FTLIGAGFLTINNNPDWTYNFASNFAPIGIAGIVAAMGLTFIAFEGYEIIVQTGEEVKNPRKNIPRAIFISLTLVVLLYCLVAFVSITAISPNDTEGIPVWNFIGQNGDLGISKAAEIFLPYGSFIILAGGIVSSLAALNATTYSSARVAFAMGRHYNLPHQLSNIHHKFKTPYLATIISGIIMAVMAWALPLDQIALAAGVIFLLLFTQVNIAVITIRRIHGDRLQYGFKTPFFPIIPIIGIFLKSGLAIYLLITQPLSWVVSILWIAIGFAIYRIYTFRKEIEHYAPIVTSEGDLARKHFRILIPYTPENPDRLIKYAIRVAKENNGEINILRVITVPHQTPLSAGTAFTERASKAFEPLENMIDKENILNHYFVRISHDANEAILSTIAEQKIDLLITDYETLRRNNALQTLATCNMLAILTGGVSDEELVLEDSIADRRNGKKNLVVLYDGGDHSDMVLKTASWLEHSGKFNTTILSIKKKEEGKHIGYSKIDNQDLRYKKDKEKEKHVKYLEQIGVGFREVFVTDVSRNNSQELCQLILSSINASQPDLLVTGKRIGKFSVFDNEHFVSLLERLNCPVIVARSFVIPGLSRIRSSLMKAIHHS
ncbi:MAG TPA: amino acid permease, partial [Nitrososphaeraceae archaeon]